MSTWPRRILDARAPNRCRQALAQCYWNLPVVSGALVPDIALVLVEDYLGLGAGKAAARPILGHLRVGMELPIVSELQAARSTGFGPQTACSNDAGSEQIAVGQVDVGQVD